MLCVSWGFTASADALRHESETRAQKIDCGVAGFFVLFLWSVAVVQACFARDCYVSDYVNLALITQSSTVCLPIGTLPTSASIAKEIGSSSYRRLKWSRRQGGHKRPSSHSLVPSADIQIVDNSFLPRTRPLPGQGRDDQVSTKSGGNPIRKGSFAVCPLT